MSKRDHNLFLEDMLDAIEAISRYTNSLDIKSFIDDRKTVDAVIRNLEILGEAASQVPESFKNKSVNIDRKRWNELIKDSVLNAKFIITNTAVELRENGPPDFG